jgi:penicillin-binding protein 2
MPISQDNRVIIRRLTIARIVVILVFLALGLKLWHITVVRYDHFRKLAEHNQVRTIPLLAPRGTIFDRDGRPLVENITSFNLFVYRDEIDKLDDLKGFLQGSVELSPDQVDERLEAAANYAPFQPVLLKPNLGLDQVARILAHQAEYPEIRIIEQPRRLYRYDELAAHSLGYVGEVSQAELDSPEFDELSPGDTVGKAGIERVYNSELMGENGYSRILVNSAGKALQELGRVEPQPGNELRLTLDLDLQRVAERELGEQPGAILAFDPRSGEVLVLASRPAFDPNWFATRITRGQWDQLMNNPDNPMQNRVIQSTFSPGSIFKVVMALAGLELGLVTPETSVYCNGAVTIYGHPFHCWKAGGHGRVRLADAIQHSCNVYFYLLGQKMGIEEIAEFSRRIGLGRPTGIDLNGEVVGLVPSPEWKKRTLGQPWFAGETISVAIGQGPLNVTPAQLARAIGAVATGRVPRLRLIKDPAAKTTPLTGFSPKNLEIVRDAMWKVVNEWGTGHSAKVAGFNVCGKTGSAQTISRRVRETLSEEEQQKYEANAWFAGFAPREDPEIVIAVIVQRGGSGGAEAAPIAGHILEEYYRKHKTSQTETIQMAAGG